jgi:hypothetical protein
MPPEGYYERLFEDWLNSNRNGKSNYKRLTAEEQVKEIEFRRNMKYLGNLMVDYIKNNPN